MTSRATPINLALQGGGAHGAYTCGVLDRVFADDEVRVAAISGTSAGAFNAVVAAQGMFEGGREGARRRLLHFWRALSRVGRLSPIRRTPLERVWSDWSLTNSPQYIAFDLVRRLVSPYDLNPFDFNILRDLAINEIDFDKVRACQDITISVTATNVRTGLPRVFTGQEITLDALMASAALPSLFQAVEIDGEHYWDGGIMGNPPLFPLFTSKSEDIVIVQVNPTTRDEVPKAAQDIVNRLNEVSANSSLLHELRTISLINRLLDEGALDDDEYRRINIHMIESCKEMLELDASSKLNLEWGFIKHLHAVGYDVAEGWLDRNRHNLGVRSTSQTALTIDDMATLPLRSLVETARQGAV